MKKILLPLCLLSLLFACEHNVPLSDFDLKIEPEIILHSGVYEGRFYCFPMYSKSISEAGDFLPIGGLEFYLFKNGIFLNNLKTEIDTGYSISKIMDTIIERVISDYYYFIESPEISAGNNYSIKAFLPGSDTLYAETYLPKEVKIELIDMQFIFQDQNERRYSATFKVDDAINEDNFYSFQLSGENSYSSSISFWYSGLKYNYTSLYTFSDELLENNTFSIEIIEPVSGGRVKNVVFDIYQMDSASFFRWKATELQHEMTVTSEFYAFEPINTYSNVSNGYGIFGGSGPVYSDSIKLTELFPDL